MNFKDKHFLFDIDGVLCTPQKPISSQMENILQRLDKHLRMIYRKRVYMVTGNSHTKAVDLVGPYYPIFSNNGDVLRNEYGKVVWEAKDQPLPPDLGIFLLNQARNMAVGNNCIEWRSPSFVNFCPVGRFATYKQREEHDTSWRDEFIKRIKSRYNVQAVKGGQVSVDIYTTGADKSRAANMLKDYVFFGDKMDPDGNDYPIKILDEKKCLTVESPSHTLRLLEEIFKDGKI